MFVDINMFVNVDLFVVWLVRVRFFSFLYAVDCNRFLFAVFGWMLLGCDIYCFGRKGENQCDGMDNYFCHYC